MDSTQSATGFPYKTRKSSVRQYWCRQRLHPLQSEFKFILPDKARQPFGTLLRIAVLYLSFCVRFSADAGAACRKSCLRTGPLAPFAAHSGLRQPLRSACLGTGPAAICALEPRFQRDCPQGGTAPTRACRCGPPPLFGGIRRVATTLYCAKMQGFATAIFSPDASFTSSPFSSSLFRRCGFQLAFSLHLRISEHTTRFDFFNWQSAAFYFIVLQQFITLSRATTNTAIVLWLSQVLTSKAVRPCAAPPSISDSCSSISTKLPECLLCLRLL